ncbi:MAG: hypothetical protein AAF567_22000 [Actinomycetota bacterium]
MSGITTRRGFLAGALTTAVVGTGFTSAASAQTATTMTVWRIDPDWGYPRGPNNKTHLFSNASRAAAQHRWALSSADAECMNLHVGSWAPAVPVAVDQAAFMQLWNAASYTWANPWKNVGVQIFDDRHVAGVPGGTTLFQRAMNPVVPIVVGVPDPTPTAAATAGDEVEGVAQSAAAPVGSAIPAAPLAVTGIDVGLRAAASLGLVATGAAFVRISRRRQILFEHEYGTPD